MAQIDGILGPEIEDPAVGLLPRRRSQQGVHHVVHVVEISYLPPITVDVNRLALHQPTNPDTQEGLPRVLDPHPRPIGIGQAEDSRPDPIDVVVHDVVPLARHLVDAVHVGRTHQGLFGHRQRRDLAVLAARAGKNYFDPGIIFTARFQNG